MNRMPSSLLVAATLFVTASVGCSGTTPPTCTSCGPTTNPTPFTPGQLPGSAATLQGSRCGAPGSRTFVFNNILLGARLADLTTNTLTFAHDDPFVIYWSVCNAGMAPSDAAATPQGLMVTGPSFGQTFSWDLPSLTSCQCVVPIPQVQFATGLATPGTYTATLVGQFATSATITIN